MPIKPYNHKLFELVELTSFCAQYPHFFVNDSIRSYHNTLKEAEQAITKAVALKSGCGCDEEQIFGYYVRELPWGVAIHGNDSLCTRSYLADGSFFCESICSMQNEPFPGRSAKDCKFAKGDIVEVLDPNSNGFNVGLEIVLELPPNPERVTEIVNKMAKLYPDVNKEDVAMMCFDALDDAYVTLDSDVEYMESHRHRQSVMLFPPHLPIPDSIRKELERAYEKNAT